MRPCAGSLTGRFAAWDRGVGMQVIGAGFPRTGTLSTQAALNRLGLPCYHMVEVLAHEQHTDAWYDFLVGGRPMSWTALFADYEATVDAPAAFFYREIMEAFPESKVLLNVRDSAAWFDSFMTLNGVIMELSPQRDANPRFDRWLSVGERMIERVFGETPDRESAIRVFEEHNGRVRDEVPADRLLVFRVQDGWGPLCELVGRDVPSEPFPHLNEGADTIRAGVRAAFGLA
jgi:hypothetical protein